MAAYETAVQVVYHLPDVASRACKELSVMYRAARVEITDGATRLLVTLSPADGARRWYTRLPPPVEPDAALDALNTLLTRALTQAADGDAPTRIGVAFWGEVDAARGRTLGARMPAEWDNFPLAERLVARWDGSVRLESGVNAAALAEARLGAGQGYPSMLYVSLTRAVAAALVSEGRIQRGALGRAGRFGHWLIYPNGQTLAGKPAPRCACGTLGHLDPIASAQSLVRSAIGRASATDESTAAMLRISGGRAEAMTATQVVELATQGDPAAVSAVDDALDALALALANIVALLDPGVIVI